MGGSGQGFFGSCLSWLMEFVLFGKDGYKENDNAKIEKTRKTFEVIGEVGEVEVMCQQTYDSQPQLNLYWNSDSPFSSLPSFPDDESVEQVEQGIEDKQAKRIIERMIVGMAPPEQGIDRHRDDGGDGKPTEPDVVTLSNEK